MTFISLTFCVFLPVVLGLHFLFRNKHRQNAVLLLASYFFYGWWDYRFLALLLLSSLVDYAAGLGMDCAPSTKIRRAWLILSFASNLGALGFFKYFNFFVDSLVIALATAGVEINTSTLNIMLPVGISFYTFQTLSYGIDVYRGDLKARRDLLAYLTYVSFFPQLVAGPIERATNLLPQFERPRRFNPAEAREGCRLMLWGFIKKMLIADNLAPIVQAAYGAPDQASGLVLAFATVAFAFQIYGDFSGYSDIAAGCSRLFGVTLTRNFAFPYFSQSITEFWRRWHISLSTWFRDYLYIPLGGSRGTQTRTAFNLLTTTLISGLWHGAAWHFVAWGALHGAALSFERFSGLRRLLPLSATVPGGEHLLPRPAVVCRIAITFAITCAAWVLFRARTIEDAWLIYGKIAALLFHPPTAAECSLLLNESLRAASFLGVFILIEWMNRHSWTPPFLSSRSVAVRWAVYTVCVWLVLLQGTRRTVDFIYFQF